MERRVEGVTMTRAHDCAAVHNFAMRHGRSPDRTVTYAKNYALVAERNDLGARPHALTSPRRAKVLARARALPLQVHVSTLGYRPPQVKSQPRCGKSAASASARAG
jgi:hypothetical protein